MEKLFDETYGSEGVFNRTIWYGYAESVFDESLFDEIINFVKDDLAIPQAKGPVTTSWVIYAATQSGDAIGDKVRASLMIRNKDGAHIVHPNMSDFDFVMNYDEINRFAIALAAKLNAQP